jgi:hypothetical protein
MDDCSSLDNKRDARQRRELAYLLSLGSSPNRRLCSSFNRTFGHTRAKPMSSSSACGTACCHNEYTGAEEDRDTCSEWDDRPLIHCAKGRAGNSGRACECHFVCNRIAIRHCADLDLSQDSAWI